MDFRIDHDDCLLAMSRMDESSVDLILTDPPYRQKNLAWDKQWANVDAFIAWYGTLCQEWRRILKPNGSLYCFMGDDMVARCEVELGRWLNVLNRIVWAKADKAGNGQWKKSGPEVFRSYFPQAEYILFAEHYGADNAAKGEAGYVRACDQARGFVFEPLRAYLDGERRRAGIDKAAVNEACGFSPTPGGMASRHYFSTSQWGLPTESHYSTMRQLFNAQGQRPAPPYDDYHDAPRYRFEANGQPEYLRADYEYLRADYEELRRPFFATPQRPYTDVWTTFPTVSSYPGKHPCEKPVALLSHIIETSSRPGALVLDCFCGSGATGEAALKLNRRFIGIEQDEGWVQRSRERLTVQGADLFALAAGG